MARKLAVVPPDAKRAGPEAPWSLLGFDTERDMLLDDLRALERRLKSAETPAHTVAALSKRKYEVLDQIKAFDARASEESDDDAIPDDIKFDGSAV